ncbi:MAG: response regulator [Chitinispirillales bacterium]|nr:response regulator [Chitinispirillales bacterium]
MSKVRKNSVLVIDDSNSDIMAFSHILNPEYTVYAAKNGQNGILAAHKYLPDVILLDVVMPEMDGYAVLSELKLSEKTRNIPVIFVTGLSNAVAEEKGFTLGVADYIIKPYSEAIVKLRIKNQMQLIEQFRSNEYDIMKYKLANDALKIGLWDMNVVSEDPVNPQNKFTWSQEARQMLGFTDENDLPDMLHSWSDRIHPEDKDEALGAFVAHINDITGETPYNLEYRLMLKSGEYRIFQAFGTTRRNNAGIPIRTAGALMDITEKKQTEEQARQQAEAEMTSQAKSAFLANMSHEIRTPMNAIMGITEIMMQSDTLPQEVEEGLGKIHSSCDMLLGIINDILDFSKIEAGKLDVMPTQYTTANLINDSAQLNIMKIDNKPIEFELQIDDGVPAKLIGDQLRIKQILNNLLSNGFKYTESGKVILSVTSEIIPDKEETMLVLGVRDTGFGMTKEQLEKLFDEYSRFEHKSSRTIEGTGLGLAITLRLVNLMNGKIHVESEPGVGTLFVVRLPQGKVDDEVLGKELAASLQKFRMGDVQRSKRSQITREPMPYGKVLIVDDTETNLYVATGLLKFYKLQIETATNGRLAIDKIESGNKYDIVFMDHMMPEMDGMEATKRLRDSGYTDPIVALTANAVAGQANIFLQNGFDAFISKPIDVRQLNAVLNTYIRDRQPPEVIEAARLQADSIKATNEDLSQMDSMLLESFVNDALKAAAMLEELLQVSDFENEKNLQNFTITVHGMKSSLFNIGEKTLSTLAFKLETAGRVRNIELIKESSPGFLKKLRRVIEKVRPEKADTEGSENEDIADLRDKLLTVKDLCADYNRKNTLDILAEIKSCSKETRAALDGIKELVLQSNFEEAEKAAAAYADELSSASGKSCAYSKNIAQLLNAKIAGLDIIKGLERYESDEEMYLKILRSYVTNIGSMLNSMEFVSKDNITNYGITVHGIKGASLDIFAKQIGKTANELEDAAAAGNIDYISRHNAGFLETARKMISELDGVLSTIETENPKPKKDKPDKEALLKLIAACKSYDMDGADAAMDDIEEFQYTSDDDLANWLRESVDLMNFEEIIEKLSILNI